MVDNCKHVTRIKTGLELGILSPERWQCVKCGTTESVWACLSCPNVACGRYNEEHALRHYNETKHPLSIEVNEKFVFCYECDDFILNDNAPGDLKLLRMALDAVAAQNFEELRAIEGGRRILRSKILTETSGKSRRLLKADHVHTALVKHRRSQLSWAMRKWFTAFLKKRQLIVDPDSINVTSTGSSKKHQSSNLEPGFTGLRNLGNTCYMNSVLQILSHTASFSNFIVGHNPSEVIPQSRKYPFVHQTTSECFEVVDSPCKKAAVVFLGSDRLQQQQPSLPSAGTSVCSEASTSSGPSTPSTSGGLNGGSSNIKATEALTYADKPSHSLYEELHALFRVLWSGKRAMVSPHSLLYAIWVAVPAFKGYKQQDAQEFLGVLLDKLQSELHEPGRWNPGVQDFITRSFQGRLVSRVICSSCSHVTTTEDPFLDLSLAFPSACQSGESNECDLKDMLQLFINETAIDGKAYACKACNRRRRSIGNSSSHLSFRRRSSCGSTGGGGEEAVCTPPPQSGHEGGGEQEESGNRSMLYTAATQTLRISRLPKVLRLHLKRFRWMGRQREKLCCHVKFPATLDLSSMYTENSMEPGDTVPHYELTGVIVHHGRGFMSGHYTAYCLNDESESWIHCNDANMTPCSFDEVSTSQAYILLYSQLVCDPATANFQLTSVSNSLPQRLSSTKEVTPRRRNNTEPSVSSDKKRKLV